MVIVVCFVRRQQRQVVTAVRNGAGRRAQHDPEHGRREVRAHQDRAGDERQQVGEPVLERVAVDGRDADRAAPLVVDLVVLAVEVGQVKQPAWRGQRSEDSH